jgi:hypothetical protein
MPASIVVSAALLISLPTDCDVGLAPSSRTSYLREPAEFAGVYIF